MNHKRIVGVFILFAFASLPLVVVKGVDTSFTGFGDGEWISPEFESTGNTRMELYALALSGAADPLLSVGIMKSGGEPVGLPKKHNGDGITVVVGFPFPAGNNWCYLETHAQGLVNWKIYLYNLATGPVTTTPATTTTTTTPTTTTEPPITTPPEGVITETQYITVRLEIPITTTVHLTTVTESIAVFTECPKSWILVPFTYMVIGLLFGFIMVFVLMIKFSVDIIAMKRTKPDESPTSINDQEPTEEIESADQNE